MKRITKIEVTEINKKKKLRVAAYARVSTDSDKQLASLKSQKTHYERYIKARSDWEYAGLYYDEGISGTKLEKREGLLRLLSDCEKGMIDKVIIKSISRFSRNTLDSIETVRRLHEKGVHFYFEREKLDTGKMDSELLLSVLSSLAESESRSISENQAWSIQKRYMNGTFKIGYPPYGYKNINGEMVVVPEEAEVVRWIFEQVLAGKSSGQIGKELNAKGIPAKRGGKWSEGSVGLLVKNEKYVGDCIFQKTYTDDRFYRHVNHGEKNQYYVRNHHEAIVSRETFDAVNSVIDANRLAKGIEKGTAKYQRRDSLSGKVFCGNCGGKMKRVCREEFACIAHRKDTHSCSMLPVKETTVKAAFVNMMNKLTFARGKILVPYAEKIKKKGEFLSKRSVEEIELLIERNLERRLQIQQFFSKGLLDPAVYEEERSTLVDEETKLIAEKNMLLSDDGVDNEYQKAIVEILKFTGKGNMLTDFDEKLFGKYVDHINIYSRSEIGFVMKCGPEFRERI